MTTLADPIYVRVTERVKKKLDDVSKTVELPISEIIRQILDKEILNKEGVLYTNLKQLKNTAKLRRKYKTKTPR